MNERATTPEKSESHEKSAHEQYQEIKRLCQEYAEKRQRKIDNNIRAWIWSADLEDTIVRIDEDENCIFCDEVVSNQWRVWLKEKDWKFFFVNWQRKHQPKEYPLDEKELKIILDYFPQKIQSACDLLHSLKSSAIEDETWLKMRGLVRRKVNGFNKHVEKALKDRLYH